MVESAGHGRQVQATQSTWGSDMATERLGRPGSGPAGTASPHVLRVTGPSAGQPTLYLPQGENLIGRAPTAIVRITDTAVSERHASILIRGLRASIRDLGSTNGTYVNQKIIQGDAYTILHTGDVITVGRRELRYELLERGASTGRPRPPSTGGEGVPSEGDSPVLALARAQYAQGRYDEAARTIWPLLQTMPNDFAVLSIYGMALKQAGKHAEAVDPLRRALSIRESETLRQALNDILSPPPRQQAAAPPPPPPTQQAGSPPPPSQAPATGTLAGDLDRPSRPDSRDSRDGLKGPLVHKWHRSIFSFLSFWLGLIVAIGGAVLPRVIALRGKVSLPVIALGAVLIMWSILRYAFTRYTVYERRIDFASGVLFQRRTPIWLYDITDISMRRSPMLAGRAAIDVEYETTKKKAGSESLIAVASGSQMREFMERLQEDVLQERRSMKKQWI
jgi:membrane protein YdbS with pleckstrin-like domain